MITDILQSQTLREYCNQSPDWLGLAQEIAGCCFASRMYQATPHYRRALLFGPLPAWHIVLPNPQPPADLPARWCYLILDCRELKEGRRAAFFKGFPQLEEALMLVAQQLAANPDRLDLSKPLQADFPNAKTRWTWFA